MDLSPNDFFPDDYVLTEDDLAAAAREIERAEASFDDYAFLATPKMPCPECAGSGRIYAGMLGDACPTCLGARVVDRPDADSIKSPFPALRRALGAYSDAQKLGRALPPASTVIRAEAAARMGTEVRQLASALPNPVMNLPEPKKQAAGMLGHGEAEFSDEDLDEMEDEDADA